MEQKETLSFLDDTKRVIDWIAENIENEENATLLVTWILKMANKLKDNIEELQKLQEEENENDL